MARGDFGPQVRFHFDVSIVFFSFSNAFYVGWAQIQVVVKLLWKSDVAFRILCPWLIQIEISSIIRRSRQKTIRPYNMIISNACASM